MHLLSMILPMEWMGKVGLVVIEVYHKMIDSKSYHSQVLRIFDLDLSNFATMKFCDICGFALCRGYIYLSFAQSVRTF